MLNGIGESNAEINTVHGSRLRLKFLEPVSRNYLAYFILGGKKNEF
jgi:hypothetical protein